MEAKNKSTKIITIAALVVLFIAVIIGGLILNKSKKAVHQLSSEYTMLESEMQERDSLVNEFVSAFDTIESSLTFINEKRGQLVLNDGEVTVSQKNAIIRDIQLMNAMLEESNQKMAELEKNFEKSGIQLKSFKNKIAHLNKTIDLQNKQISELKFKYDEQSKQLAMVSYEKDSLKNEVSSFRDSIQAKENIIVQRDSLISEQIGELNKAFFAYGTSKELTQNGLIEKEGGFLGIGRNTSILNNFNENYFTKIDITEQRSIELNAKKVHLVSEHPGGSYKLIEENGLITRLEIETPADFWKISQYAVIEVKL